MLEIKKQLLSHKENINKNLLILRKKLGYLYQVYNQKNNNKLIFIKRGADKVGQAHKYLTSLTLSYSHDEEDLTEVADALKEALAGVKNLTKALEDKDIKLRRAGISNQNLFNYRKDLDSLHLAYDCLKGLDTDMGLSEKDLNKDDLKDLRS